MDPLSALRKEIEQKKTRNASDFQKWKSRTDLEKEREIVYHQREKLLEEQQTAKKRRKIGPLMPSHHESKESTTQPAPEASNLEATSIAQKNSKSMRPSSACQQEVSANHVGQSIANSEKQLQEANDTLTSAPNVEAKSTTTKEGSGKPYGEVNECREDQVHGQIRKYMRLWKSEIDQMSPEQSRKREGRTMISTFQQTKTWLRPLEKLLRKRKLQKNILNALKDIFHAAEEREYIVANRLYLERLAIGNAPWPMGATMVGIHARAAREKIGEDNIAHVMNDEQTRKYIQGIKRLLTVAQRHFPAAFSKMVM